MHLTHWLLGYYSTCDFQILGAKLLNHSIPHPMQAYSKFDPYEQISLKIYYNYMKFR